MSNALSALANPLARRVAAEHAAAAAVSPAVARPANRQALDAFLERGLPTARDENWRYANLKALEKASFAPALAPGAATALAEVLPDALEGHSRHVFIDGLYAPALSTAAAQPGLTVTAGQAPRLPPAADRDTHQGFALLNDAFAADGADIHLTAGSSAAVEVLFVSNGTDAVAAYPRLTVRLERGSKLDLVERHLSPATAAGLVSTAIGVEVGDGATLDHCRLQQAGAAAAWMDSLSAAVGRDGAYNTHVVQLGALSARSTTQVRLAAPGAALNFNAVAVADARQVLDNMMVVEHQAPNTRTQQNFRGIAGARSRLAFNGKIIVQAAAQKADSAQSLRGLIAGAEAEIDLRPQLEIYTDDVRCSHGATTGKLDDNMLFYLLSRGLEPAVAQRLLKWAFLTDIVARISQPQLRQQVRQALVGHMQDADALKELL